MFKLIIYLIITIAIIHFILYYFNFDFKFNSNYFKNFKNSKIGLDQLNITSLNDYINELKILNECINNGKIDNFIS
jgi:hypothetical protein